MTDTILSQKQRLAPDCWTCSLPGRAKWFCETDHPMIMWADDIPCPMCAETARCNGFVTGFSRLLEAVGHSVVRSDPWEPKVAALVAKAARAEAAEAKVEQLQRELLDTSNNLNAEVERADELHDGFTVERNCYNQVREERDDAEVRLARLKRVVEAARTMEIAGLGGPSERAFVAALREYDEDMNKITDTELKQTLKRLSDTCQHKDLRWVEETGGFDVYKCRDCGKRIEIAR